MSAAPQPEPRWTAEAYLAFERASETKHEFIHGEVIAMSGASLRHIRITRNLYGMLYDRLKGGTCEYLTSDMRVKVQADGAYVYPDALIVCGDVQLEDEQFDTLLNPTVIVEILSKSTMSHDLIVKWGLYRHLPTLRECLFISQERMEIQHRIRQHEREWLMRDVIGEDAVLTLEAVGAHLSLSDIYEGVRFDED